MPDRQQHLLDAIEALYFGYRNFTAGPDRILQKRGLSRMHHRILYFVARQPGQPVNHLLETLAITKQALNQPLRQLVSMNLIDSAASREDGRVRELRLTTEGRKLERSLTATQQRLLEKVFSEAGEEMESGWLRVMQQLADHH